MAQHDGIHTRLTHSLEVSCIGRSMGMLAAEKIKDELPVWISPADVGAIIQAACLAHETLVTHPSVMQVNMQFVNGLTMPHIMIFKKVNSRRRSRCPSV